MIQHGAALRHLDDTLRPAAHDPEGMISQAEVYQTIRLCLVKADRCRLAQHDLEADRLYDRIAAVYRQRGDWIGIHRGVQYYHAESLRAAARAVGERL